LKTQPKVAELREEEDGPAGRMADLIFDELADRLAERLGAAVEEVAAFEPSRSSATPRPEWDRVERPGSASTSR